MPFSTGRNGQPKTMKTCWIFFAIFATTLSVSNKLKQKLSRVQEDCRQVHRIDDVKQLQDFDAPKLEQYLFCIFTIMTWMDERGSLLLTDQECKDLLPHELSDEEKEEIIERCNSLRGDNPQDTVLLIYKCYSTLYDDPSFFL